MNAALKVPFVSVVNAGRVVGNGRGLDGARDDAQARRVRLLEARAGRTLRDAELAEVELWASGLLPEDVLPEEHEATPARAPTPAPAAPSPAVRAPTLAPWLAASALPSRTFDAQGQVLLFRPAPNRSPTDTGNRRPRLCAACRAELPPYPGRGCPRRFCTACRPPAKAPVALEGSAPPARRPRRRRSGATGAQALLWPELAGACRGCKGNLAPYAGLGAPRRFCATCRPPRRHDPRRTPRVGDRVLIEGGPLLVVGRSRLPLGGRRWAAGVEARRESGLLVVIPLADWRATNVEVLHGA